MTRRNRSLAGYRSVTGLAITVWAVCTLGWPLPTSADAADRIGSGFSLHGHLTQAYGISDDHQIFGIPEDGTADLLSVALQIRYEISREDAVVVQFNHERTGETELSKARDDVQLDSAFYRRSFSANTSLSVGRIPLPWGIYNQTRDVGTVLPLFRAPVSIYGEGGQTTVISQNLDGLLFSHRSLFSTWSIDVDLYAGEWGAFIPRAGGTIVTEEQFTDVLGLQLWFNTPVPGVRFGTAVNQFEGPGLFAPPGVEFDFESFLLSADAPIGRFSLQAEYVELEGDFDYVAYYGHLAYHATENFTVFAQAETAEFDLIIPPFGSFTLDFNEDWAVGVSYHFPPGSVLKVEAHFTEGFAVEDVPVINPFGPPFETNYGVVSFAVSF